MSGPTLDLTTREGLETALTSLARAESKSLDPDGTFCPSCGDPRRMAINPLYWNGEGNAEFENSVSFDNAAHCPSLFVLICVQCRETRDLVVSPRPSPCRPRTAGWRRHSLRLEWATTLIKRSACSRSAH